MPPQHPLTPDAALLHLAAQAKRRMLGGEAESERPMSLTSFLQNRDVRQRFRQEIVIPPMAVKREILAPPLSGRYSLVGTAFDYLMRFFLKQLNQDAVTTGWIAELALLNDVIIDRRSGEIVHFRGTKLGRKAQRIIEQAKMCFPTSPARCTPNTTLEPTRRSQGKP